jgi:hypothetical protein
MDWVSVSKTLRFGNNRSPAPRRGATAEQAAVLTVLVTYEL